MSAHNIAQLSAHNRLAALLHAAFRIAAELETETMESGFGLAIALQAALKESEAMAATLRQWVVDPASMVDSDDHQHGDGGAA